MTKLIPFVVLAVVTVGCASDNVTLPTGSDSMVLSSVSNVEIAAADMENLLFLEACLDMEIQFMEKKMEYMLDFRANPFSELYGSEEVIDRIGNESRDALQNCLERR